MRHDPHCRRAEPASSVIEFLEPRELLSALPYTISRHHALVIQGSRHGTSISVSMSGKHGKFLNITINGKAFQFRSASIHGIIFQEHSGRDHATVPRHFQLPCTIIGYDGAGGGADSSDTNTGSTDSSDDSVPPVTPSTNPESNGPTGSDFGNGATRNSSGDGSTANAGASDAGDGFDNSTGSDFTSDALVRVKSAFGHDVAAKYTSGGAGVFRS